MAEPTPIDKYLHEIEAYLTVDRSQRQRLIDEIHGHLVDAADAHLADGHTWEQAARLALGDLGSPEEVAMQFAATPRATRVVRGWRRWAPVVLPGVLLIPCVGMAAWMSMRVPRGLSRGEQIALRAYLSYGLILSLLVVAVVVSIRRADRDPGWRIAAWSCAVASAGVLMVSVVT